MMCPIDLLTSFWPRVGVAFDRPDADSSRRFRVFCRRDNTLNV